MTAQRYDVITVQRYFAVYRPLSFMNLKILTVTMEPFEGLFIQNLLNILQLKL